MRARHKEGDAYFRRYHRGEVNRPLGRQSAPLRRQHSDDADARGNDDDVPIAEAERFYIALQDVGADTAPAGYGIREPKHSVDWIDRSIKWYEKYFSRV